MGGFCSSCTSENPIFAADNIPKRYYTLVKRLFNLKERIDYESDIKHCTCCTRFKKE